MHYTMHGHYNMQDSCRYTYNTRIHESLTRASVCIYNNNNIAYTVYDIFNYTHYADAHGFPNIPCTRRHIDRVHTVSLVCIDDDGARSDSRFDLRARAMFAEVRLPDYTVNKKKRKKILDALLPHRDEIS